MKLSLTALCIAAGVLGSSMSFAATPAALTAPAARAATAASAATAAAPVTTPAKKVVKKHAAEKTTSHAKKAPAAG